MQASNLLCDFDVQFYVDDVRIEFALQIIRHDLNEQCSNVLRDMKHAFTQHTDIASTKAVDSIKTVTSQITNWKLIHCNSFEVTYSEPIKVPTKSKVWHKAGEGKEHDSFISS